MILTREANEHLLDTYYNFIHATHNYALSQLYVIQSSNHSTCKQISF